MQSYYVNSRASVRVGNGLIDWFPVKVQLHQGCVMSSWLHNIYMDGVVWEVNERLLGRGLSPMSDGDRE